jgi:hypothetical protein
MAIGMHKILKSENEAKSARDEEDGAYEVGRLFCGAASHEVQGGDQGQLEKRKDGIRQPKDAEPMIFMIGGGDPDLADGGNLRD